MATSFRSRTAWRSAVPAALLLAVATSLGCHAPHHVLKWETRRALVPVHGKHALHPVHPPPLLVDPTAYGYEPTLWAPWPIIHEMPLVEEVPPGLAIEGAATSPSQESPARRPREESLPRQQKPTPASPQSVPPMRPEDEVPPPPPPEVRMNSAQSERPVLLPATGARTATASRESPLRPKVASSSPPGP